MKNLILVLTIAISSAFSSAAFAGPSESVSKTLGEMLEILKGANESRKVSQLCQLVKTDVDAPTIGTQLLGTYASLNADAQGVLRFKELVPSIIMDQFYDLLNTEANATYSIIGTVPKGSGRVGVKTNISGKIFVITVLRSNNKIVDVEWNNLSLVNTKRGELQRRLAGYNTDKPVSALVDHLNNEGVNKCR